ncbi:hypothetical protein FPOA_06165 [Fusarium poae]|uniref:TFIIS-type domain-containing protein n=1 Tax=Fusarium poae TaxID=36050 RepID=A0A1B8AZ15_FUSPO|nr:hypothetical protein FPOA_06165 [Fusarium poae]
MSKNTLIGTVIVSIAEDPAEVRKTPWLNKSKKISSLDTWTKIAEECTNSRCGAQEVRYIALQLRSADEGTTMFYFCKKCDHRWTEDN